MAPGRAPHFSFADHLGRDIGDQIGMLWRIQGCGIDAFIHHLRGGRRKRRRSALTNSRMRVSTISWTDLRNVRTVPTILASRGITLIAPGWPGLERPNGYDGGIQRIHIARHDGLQGRDDLPGDRHRIDGLIRMGAMPATACDQDLEAVGGSHHRPRIDADRAPASSPASCAAHRSHRTERYRTARLQASRARRRGPLPRVGKSAPRYRRNCAFAPGTSQPRSTTAVWPSWPQPCIRPDLVDLWLKVLSSVMGQRIHVRTQADHAAAVATLAADDTDHAGLANAGDGPRSPAPPRRPRRFPRCGLPRSPVRGVRANRAVAPSNSS